MTDIHSKMTVYFLALAIASAAAWLGFRRAARGSRIVLALIAAGATLWALADLMSFTADSTIVQASWPDVLYLGGYGPLLLALAGILVRGQRDRAGVRQESVGSTPLSMP